MRRILGTWAVLIGLAGTAAAQAPVTLTVDPSKVEGPVDAAIYGHFLEHIYNSVQGGLWGQMVLNGSLEIFNPESGVRFWDMIGQPEVITETQAGGRRGNRSAARAPGRFSREQDQCPRHDV
jgi:hypothetical protein